MASAFSSPTVQNPGGALLIALVATCAGIALILIVILLRRVIRSRYFKIRDERARLIRENWQRVLEDKGSDASWFARRLDRQIIEEMAKDRMEVARGAEKRQLQALFCSSGMLDRRIREVRGGVGWSKRKALLSLGRMQLPQGLPALAETLDDPSDDVILDAIRALGLVGTPEAGNRIVERLARRPVQCPALLLQAALANCFRGNPSRLASLIPPADDGVRPILTRALAEVAKPGTAGDLRDLVTDPLPDVRASAARILSAVRPPYLVTALAELAGDAEWFVRLRAMVALGDLRQAYTVPVLLQGLCDANRLVRLRAASALAQIDGEELPILHMAMQTSDRYALQALVSELERSGRIVRLANSLENTEAQVAEAALAAALHGGAARILTDLMLNHRSARVRERLSAIMSRSQDPALLGYLELALCGRVSKAQSQSLQRLL